MTAPALVADIGGTNTRVALAEGTRIITPSIQRFRNAEHEGLAAVLQGYLKARDNPRLSGACAAAAGPVHDNVARLTNLDWTIDAATLCAACGVSQAAVLNDLQAQGHALDLIPHTRITTLITAPAPRAPATRMVIGIGTGFNAAPVHEGPQGRVVLPSECGHATLPARDETGLRLSRFLTRSHGYPDIEEVLSGRGLENLYAFLSQEAGTPRHQPAAQIATALGADQPEDPLITETGRHFACILGRVCSDLALIHLPFGGIYLCGGVARALAPHLAPLGLIGAFRDKGRFSSLMQAFSLSVIEDDYAALTGCAAFLSSRRPSASPLA